MPGRCCLAVRFCVVRLYVETDWLLVEQHLVCESPVVLLSLPCRSLSSTANTVGNGCLLYLPRQLCSFGHHRGKRKVMLIVCTALLLLG